jgi:hypothetical protein
MHFRARRERSSSEGLHLRIFRFHNLKKVFHNLKQVRSMPGVAPAVLPDDLLD